MHRIIFIIICSSFLWALLRRGLEDMQAISHFSRLFRDKLQIAKTTGRDSSAATPSITVCVHINFDNSFHNSNLLDR